MARAIYPQWPAPPGDEFTFDELMDDIAARQQSIDSKENRDAEFLRAFKSMIATPEQVAEYDKQEAIKAQDAKAREDEYQRYAAESAEINRKEAERQGLEERERALQDWSKKYPEAMDMYNKGIIPTDAPPPPGWNEPPPGMDKYLEEEVYYSEPETVYENTGLPRGEEPPRLVYKDTDLIDASRLTQGDLDWMKSMESEDHPRFTQEDVDTYKSLEFARDQAKAIIDGQLWEREEARRRKDD